MTAPVTGVVLLADSTALPAPRTGDMAALLAVVGHAVDGGIRTVVVRDKHRPLDERRALVAGVRRHLDPVVGTVLLAHDDEGADLLGADGVHRSSGRRDHTSPPPVADSARSARPVIGWSAHDAVEVARAAAFGADYVMVSPVYPTASKPGYGPTLGPDGLAALIEASPIPLIALGGITTPDDAAECCAAGVVGVAVMGAVLRSADPSRTASALVAAEREHGRCADDVEAGRR